MYDSIDTMHTLLCDYFIVCSFYTMQWRSQGGAGGANAPPQIVVVPLFTKNTDRE